MRLLEFSSVTFLNKISVEILQMLRSIEFLLRFILLDYHKLGIIGKFLELFLTVDCCCS